MRTLKELCIPRKSVFDISVRDTVLDISDVIEDHIDPDAFFSENWVTESMRILIEQAFRRFAGQSDSGVFKLTQAMGGGKTHCMIALALLAKHPKLREDIIGNEFKDDVPDEVDVIAFNGRETDTPYGIWGEIAKQLKNEKKANAFRDYYSPLRAPSQSAWVELLKGERVVIFLDELPFYFENARSRPIGNSDLAAVTETALSNLLVAVQKAELSQVCVVISDLRQSYESASRQIHEALRNFESEVGRGSIELEPVKLNSEELYQILKKRLFEELPSEEEIREIADAYGQSIHDAQQMNLTHVSADTFAQQVYESYPFHPAIRDLYARFRENQGFYQTRGLIRLMRVIISNLFVSEAAATNYLIHPHMLDLNNSATLAEIQRINPTLENAITHDIASSGRAAAELADSTRAGSDAQDICKLLLVSSLANVQNATLGLTDAEIFTYLCSPNRDLAPLPEVVSTLENQACWYLHRGNDGRIFFKNTKNLIARLTGLAPSVGRDVALKEISTFLTDIFAPQRKDCYQSTLVFPAIDRIEVFEDKVLLILYQPAVGRLHPDILAFFAGLSYKNRVLFLSGQHSTMDRLVIVGQEYKAIEIILDEMDRDNIRSDDPQRQFAVELKDTIMHRLGSAARETFTTLAYPFDNKLVSVDINMSFEDNEYRGEGQITKTLLDKQKFTTDVNEPTFRKKCEDRLFTQPSMQWIEIKRRAATITKWPWHHPGALDALKKRMLNQGQWRESGGYIEKGPFPKPTTSVEVLRWDRDEDTGLAFLEITPVHGDVVYFNEGAPATLASARIEDLQHFCTSAMNVSFLCVDSAGEHATGEPLDWHSSLTLKKESITTLRASE